MSGQPGVFPLDDALNLPERCYSDLLMESAELLAVDGAYDKGLEVMARLLGLTLPELALETSVAEHSQPVKAFYRQKDKFPIQEEGRILVATNNKPSNKISTGKLTGTSGDHIWRLGLLGFACSAQA
jgi:hypothetical protein